MIAVTFAIALLTQSPDSVQQENKTLDEVVITSAMKTGGKRAAKGQAATIEEHLMELEGVNLIRRGSYAWEPVVNNMQSERVSTTIDGMKIFYACTDKMDPVTSYVESGNLQRISLNSGLAGNPQATGNIGGSLDLKLRKAGFDGDPFLLNTCAGHEWNGHMQVYGADAAVSTHAFYTNGGIFYRHAGDYKAGGGHEVDYSQFRKTNAFVNAGGRVAERHIIEGSFIYDLATNVGYPALNMDVARAQGVISSLSYRWLLPQRGPWSSFWETKAYYNHITHVMDDTHRPDVEIHMDMPGRSQTGGMYSMLRAYGVRHELTANADLYYNRLFADMTMYPGGAAPMYMVTWPDVGTLCEGISLGDVVTLAHHQTLHLTGKASWQQQRINSREGYDALRVFFPIMRKQYSQFTGRVAASYCWSPKVWKLQAGAGWGSRAPTVTEAYGYYLNNTFDQYDYIGNPYLHNESAIELNASAGWHHQAGKAGVLHVQIDANTFLFSNYIIGELEPRISPMTVGCQGVKVYRNQGAARVVNTSLTARYKPLRWLECTTRLSYAQGRDGDGEYLPLVSPFAHRTRLTFAMRHWEAVVTMQGNGRQVHYGSRYGETPTPAYTVLHLSASYSHSLGRVSYVVRAGVENLLDKDYATYSDWNRIPQKGRNIYAHLSLSL
ncbi:MAG: hypothetical protein ACI4UA_04380 [Bacteroidaceae bacterium]